MTWKIACCTTLSKTQNTPEQLAKLVASDRNAIDGKFGEGKRHYEIELISTRLQETIETVISIQLLVMNLERRLRILFYYFFKYFLEFQQRQFGLFENSSLYVAGIKKIHPTKSKMR